jgi:hypothetical protein
MEQIANLTNLQNKLVNDLISEFTKINPTNSDSTSRFTINTINECLREEERFTETIKQHNLKMIYLYVTQLLEDIEKFETEFGNVLYIELGYHSSYSEKRLYCLEEMILQNKVRLLKDNKTYETKLFFISKSKPFTNSNDNYFGNLYTQIFVDFKRELVDFALESGKIVRAYRIIGLQYLTDSWSCRDVAHSYNTLDEMIQSNKQIQQSIVELVQ